jgi:3-deoxy-7-phosphoheptulonate synthase
MLVTLKPHADAACVQAALVRLGLWTERLAGDVGVAFAIAPHSAAAHVNELRCIEGVADVFCAPSQHPRVDAAGAVKAVSGVAFGSAPVWLAGPCSVESEAQIEIIAEHVARAGAQFLRGGAFKPRTSPYGFQGHGGDALAWLRRAASRRGLKVVTEALSERDVPLVAEHSDLIQVGARNMQNFALLREVGRAGRAVLLKRGVAATVREWLLAGEHCLQAGAASVLFCERGVRGYDDVTRNFLDLSAVALLAHVHKVSVVVDPSHACGRRDLIAPLTKAALAAGAVGIMIEVHHQPEAALSDGPQALRPDELAHLVEAVKS